MAYPPEFLKLVDKFIDLANHLAEGGQGGAAPPSCFPLGATARLTSCPTMVRIRKRQWSFMCLSTEGLAHPPITEERGALDVAHRVLTTAGQVWRYAVATDAHPAM